MAMRDKIKKDLLPQEAFAWKNAFLQLRCKNNILKRKIRNWIGFGFAADMNYSVLYAVHIVKIKLIKTVQAD